MTSLPPDITEAIPFPLTAGGAQAQSAFPADGRFDISIGSLGFLLRPTAQDPYLRASEQAAKQRVDTAPEAGEQSLSSWWLRSQTSWHRGAGIDWYEPGSEEGTAYRFHNSHNVDVWTPGEIKLLPKLVNSLATGVAAYGSTVRVSGSNLATIGYGNKLLIPPSTVETLTSGLATKPAVNGDSIYVGHEDAVSRASVTSGTVSKIRDTTGVARCWWVKSRLLAAVGPTIYWVDTTTSTGTLGAAGADDTLWTHPDPDWTW